jgi:hypothetical protein
MPSGSLLVNFALESPSNMALLDQKLYVINSSGNVNVIDLKKIHLVGIRSLLSGVCAALLSGERLATSDSNERLWRTTFHPKFLIISEGLHTND